jgi:hypothetical protein
MAGVRVEAAAPRGSGVEGGTPTGGDVTGAGGGTSLTISVGSCGTTADGVDAGGGGSARGSDAELEPDGGTAATSGEEGVDGAGAASAGIGS